jgi:hypothetical protein
MTESRGLRNCNPGNIDRSPGVTWQGQADDQSGDPRFVVFKSAQYGIRALAKTLLTYQNHDGCRSLRAIATRWAPPGENNTAAYIAALCAAAGVGPDDVLDIDMVSIMKPLVIGIIVHENGANPYADAVILEGLHLAGVADSKPPPLKTQKTFLAQAGAAAAMVGAGGTQLAQYAPTVKTAADKLSDYTGSPIVQHAVTILLTVAGGLTMVGIASAYLKQRSA